MRYQVRAGALLGFVDMVTDAGGEPLPLFQQANIHPSQLHDPDNLIPYDHFARLLELTAQTLDDPTFAYKMGLQQGLHTIGLIGAYMAQQHSLAAALQVAQKHTDMHVQGAILELVQIDNETSALVLDVVINHQKQYTQLMQSSLILVYRLLGDMLGSQWRPKAINFQQSKPALSNYHYDIYASMPFPVVFNAEFDGIIFKSDALSVKPKLPGNLVQEIITAQFRATSELTPVDFVDLVRYAIKTLLPTGDCNKKNVAMTFGFSEKKLERLLLEEGMNFRTLLNQTRHDIALHALEHRTMKMTELALNLGYSDFSAFSRSFKVWTGVAPSIYQRQFQRSTSFSSLASLFSS